MEKKMSANDTGISKKCVQDDNESSKTHAKHHEVYEDMCSPQSLLECRSSEFHSDDMHMVITGYN
jgi:hypothetical protein